MVSGNKYEVSTPDGVCGDWRVETFVVNEEDANLKKEEVRSVVVVKRSSEVISLVGPTFRADGRVSIVHEDALEYRPKKGVRFDAIWHDIWDYICADNLPEMHSLHRRYGRRTAWQGCWARELCEMYLSSKKCCH